MGKVNFDLSAVHLLIERQATSTPDATAVIFRDIRLSFQELDRRANRLAHWLRAQGVGRETVVALYLERSIDAVVGLLGVLKAGGAYLPLDASFPPARVLAICEDARAAMILTGPAQAALLPSAFVFDQVVAGEIDGAPTLCNRPNDLALVLYTSGSTGTPKGVEITHINLVNNVRFWEDTHQLSEMSAMAQTAFMSFAVFQSDVFRALCIGLTLVICPPETLLSPGSLFQLLRREKVSFLEIVPSLMRLLLRYARDNHQRLDFLRAIVVSADRWYVREHRALAQLMAPDARLSHVYGLSETTFDSTWYDATPAMLGPHDLVPIGRSFPGIHTYILDSTLRPISSGGEGELYVGGAGVARGYRNRPDLTAERFVSSPFTPGDRLFRTGDLARTLPDGTILLIGRLDQQVKIRGFRVDIGEIEAALEAHPDIKQTVVDAYETQSHEKRLVAFYVATRPCDPNALRQFLATQLPVFMLPAALVAIPTMPLTPSGKIDRSALSHIAASPCNLSRSNGDVATIVTQVVQEILGTSAISLTEPLRDRGLDSLGMSNILVGLEEVFDFTFADTDITPELFQSVDALSRHICMRIAGADSQ